MLCFTDILTFDYEALDERRSNKEKRENLTNRA